MGIKEGDEVIIPDSTFAATINAVLYCNATPVICEINNETWCIDENEIKSLITSKTKAIIPVYMGGRYVDFSKIKKIAKRYKLKIIEDAAQGLFGKNYNKFIIFKL